MSGRPRCTSSDEDLKIFDAAILNPMAKRGAAGISKEVSCPCRFLSFFLSSKTYFGVMLSLICYVFHCAFHDCEENKADWPVVLKLSYNFKIYEGVPI